MEIIIRTKNITLTPSLSEYIKSKINGLDKFFQEEWEVLARVEVEKTTKHHRKGEIFRAECQIEFLGKIFRAESLQKDLRLAINEVRNNLFRELDQDKNKKLVETRKKKRLSKEILRLDASARKKKDKP